MIHVKNSIKYLILLVVLWSSTAHAQFENLNHTENIGIDDGLSQVAVHRIVKDSRGFLWFGTVDGLNRYDGYEIKVYKNDPANPKSISSNQIDCFIEDSEQNLWISTNAGVGLHKYNPKTEEFEYYKLGSTKGWIVKFLEDENGIIWNAVSGSEFGVIKFNPKTLSHKFISFEHTEKRLGYLEKMVEDGKGNLWIAAINYGLYKLNKENETVQLFKLGSNQFQTINIDSEGILWIGTFDSGLLSFSPVNETFTIYPLKNKYGTEIIHAVAEEKETGMFWLGTDNGIFKLNPKTKIIAKQDFKLKDNFIRSLYDDGEILWVGNLKIGVTKIVKRKSTFLHFLTPLSSPFIRGIIEDKDHELWVGTDNAGINILRRENSSITSLKPHRLLINNAGNSKIYPIIEGDNGDFWIGSLGYGLTRYNKPSDSYETFTRSFNPTDSTSIKRIFSLAKGANGNIFIGAGPDPLTIYNIKTKKTKTYEGSSETPYRFRTPIINSFQKDKDDNIWIGTRLGGIYRFTEEMDGVIKYSLKDSSPYLNRSFVYSLLISNDTLWAGTTEGLFIMKLPPFSTSVKDEIVIENYLHLHEYNGLPNNIINAMLEDNHGNIWASTNKGLAKINKKTLATKSYNKHDGLQSDEFDIQSFTKTHDGYFVFGGVNGLTIFHPDSMQINENKPRIVITELEINNKKIKPGEVNESAFRIEEDISFAQEIRLSHTDNIITLTFAALDYIKSKNNQYAYQLIGFDPDWVYSGDRRTATYTNLNPGTYTFRVKGSNNDGIWNEEGTSLQIVVLPPPWRTWWAYTGYGIFFISILFIARRTVVQREGLKSGIKLQQLELKKAKEVDQIKSQLFANISHEFRTPLTLIKGPVQTLLEQATEKFDKEQLQTIQHNSDLLLKLVNQLLELARLESGTVSINKSEAELNAFINAVASSFHSLSEQKKINLQIILAEPNYLTLFDRDKTETILINLINNALKFTPAHGKVIVTATVIPQGEPEALLLLTVADTGIGIAEEKKDKVFERFYQVSESHKETGTGIGLSLVKELTEILKGRVELKSTQGEGSTFSVTLPITLLGEIRNPHESTITHVGTDVEPTLHDEVDLVVRNANTVVLVVEDHVDLRKFIISSLGNEYTFIEAGNGKEGFEKALQEVPDIIISDVMMPEMDGITMTGKIRKDIRTSHIPIILLTAKATEEAKISGLSTGADDYLIKPFDRNELILKVRNSILRQASMREKVRITLIKEVPKVEVQSADEQFLQKVKEVILQNLSEEKLSVEKVAEEIGMSRSQLFRKITALTGSSVNELIRSFRLQKAAQLLEQKWGPVSQVAYEVGFSNLSYFSKCFKEQYGVLPSEYTS